MLFSIKVLCTFDLRAEVEVHIFNYLKTSLYNIVEKLVKKMVERWLGEGGGPLIQFLNR